MIQPPKTASITNSVGNSEEFSENFSDKFSTENTGVSISASVEGALTLGSELPSTYEILRREGEIHEGRSTVLDELRRNMARLEDLHGQLHFLMKEVESILRR